MHAEVRDPVGPDGIDWVRNPSTNNSADGLRLQRLALRADAHVDGRRHDRDAVAARGRHHRLTRRTRTRSRATRSSTSRPTTRPTASSRSRGRSTAPTLPNPTNSRNLDLGALNLPAGTHTLTATVTDGALSDTVEWKIDNVGADRAAARCPRR